MLHRLMLTSAVALTLLNLREALAACPTGCECNLKVVICTGPLKAVPSDVPADTENLELNGTQGANIPKIGPANFRQLRNLKQLRMNDVGLREVEVLTFEELYQLQSIDLSRNELETVAEDIFNGPSHFLNLADNKIAAFRLPNTTNLKLREADFSGNEMKSISADNLRIARRNGLNLGLAGNPLRCDCAIGPLRDWLRWKRHDPQLPKCPQTGVENSGNFCITCKTPLEVANKVIADLTYSEVECETGPLSSREQLAMVFVCILFVAMIAAILGCMFIRGQEDEKRRKEEAERKEKAALMGLTQGAEGSDETRLEGDSWKQQQQPSGAYTEHEINANIPLHQQPQQQYMGAYENPTITIEDEPGVIRPSGVGFDIHPGTSSDAAAEERRRIADPPPGPVTSKVLLRPSLTDADQTSKSVIAAFEQGPSQSPSGTII